MVDQASATRLSMPPGLVAVAVAEDPLAAARGRPGGTLCWRAGPELLEWAVVLEPDETLRLARRAVCLGMLALADALTAAAPPECTVRIAWPATLLLQGAKAAAGHLAWPSGADEGAPPAWLVFSARLRLAWPDGFQPGEAAGQTALIEEGFEPDPPALMEAFARHLLFHADLWVHAGFGRVAAAYGKLLHPPGRVLDNGDLFQGKFPLAAALLRGAP